jgi:hypothetical protein
MYSDVTLDGVFFVKHRSVTTGSYTYDEPRDENDARVVPFGQVPPIAFSEAMGDLVRIAGRGKQESEEAGETE